MLSKKYLITSSHALLVTALLSGCSLAPEYKTPQTSLPQEWALSGDSSTQKTEQQRWWTDYNDVQLNELVTQALAYNSDLQLAAARVAEARAVLGGTTAERYPSLDLSASAARNDAGSNAASAQGGLAKPYNDFSVAPVLSFEIDLWGRLANANEAARERLLAEYANAKTVKLAVISETTANYFTIAALSEQIDITRKTIRTRKNAYDLEAKRLQAGDTDALVLRQAESQLMTAQARLPELEEQQQKRITALSVLLGQNPQQIMDSQTLKSTKNTVLPKLPALPESAPEDVLSKRPDVIAAEHALKAANADIGVARTAYLPRLSLSALLGVQSADLDTLLESSAKSWGVAGSVAGPLLDFGRARSVVEASEAREKQAYLNYEQTVRVAFREIMDALNARQKTDERLGVLSKQVKSLRETARLARNRFDSGYSSYIEVLDAERSLFEAEIALIEVERLRLQSSIDLYKALGKDA